MLYAALCHLSVVPIRSEANDRSEIVTQLLFGEMVRVLEVPKLKKNWCRVQCTFDDYEGWMDARQLTPISEKDAKSYSSNCAFCYDVIFFRTSVSELFYLFLMGLICESAKKNLLITGWRFIQTIVLLRQNAL